MQCSFLILIIFLFLPSSLWGQTLERKSFSMGVTAGNSYAKVSDLQRWSVAQGATDVTGIARNRLIGFNFLYDNGRIPFYLNTEFDIPNLRGSMPYLFSFTFQSGYTWLKNPRMEIKALAGIGLGYSVIRFRGNTPNILANLPYEHDEAFARASLLLLRGQLLISHKLPLTKIKHLQPTFDLALGFHAPLVHGAFYYGVNEEDIDGNSIAAQKVSIPEFFKGNRFVSLGFSVKLFSHEKITDAKK